MAAPCPVIYEMISNDLNDEMYPLRKLWASKELALALNSREGWKAVQLSALLKIYWRKMVGMQDKLNFIPVDPRKMSSYM